MEGMSQDTPIADTKKTYIKDKMPINSLVQKFNGRFITAGIQLSLSLIELH
jgi:hypothetical protein